MIVYLSMLVWILFVGAISKKHQKYNPITNKTELCVSKVTMFTAMFYIVFFIGLRSAGADTHAYIISFHKTATGLDTILQILKEGFSDDKAPGFRILEALVKTIFGNHYHVWLFLLSFVSGMSVANTLRRNTPYFTDAMLLFILMGIYGWMINGVRQFVAVSLSFSALDRLVQRKWKSYIFIILLLSTIHQSALFMIPIYFIVTGEAWNKRTLVLILLGVLAITFTGLTTNIWGTVMDATGYNQELYSADDGSSAIRTFIYLVPPLLSFIFRKEVKKEENPVINVCVNMSIVAVVLSLIANITSGILVGRMPIYFSIYNLILLPWLVRHIPDKSLSRFIYIAMYVLYFLLSLIEGYGYYYSDILFGGKVIY